MRPPGYDITPPPRRRRIYYAGQRIAADVLAEQQGRSRAEALVRSIRRLDRATANRALVEHWGVERLEGELARLEGLGA